MALVCVASLVLTKVGLKKIMWKVFLVLIRSPSVNWIWGGGVVEMDCSQKGVRITEGGKEK